jgi:hypothetical protein
MFSHLSQIGRASRRPRLPTVIVGTALCRVAPHWQRVHIRAARQRTVTAPNAGRAAAHREDAHSAWRPGSHIRITADH